MLGNSYRVSVSFQLSYFVSVVGKCVFKATFLWVGIEEEDRLTESHISLVYEPMLKSQHDHKTLLGSKAIVKCSKQEKETRRSKR